MTTDEMTNWDDVDAALMRMGEIEVALNKAAGEVTLKVNKIKEAGRAKVEGIEKEHKALEKAVREFCEMNKADFAQRRSRTLTFGTVGFRLVRSVTLPRDKEKMAGLLSSLKAYGLGECIVTEERADREKIAELADESIVRLGLKRTIKDSFRIQPDIQKLAWEGGE